MVYSDENAIAAAAMSGLSRPAMASGIAATLSVNALTKLLLMVATVSGQPDGVDGSQRAAPHQGKVAGLDGDNGGDRVGGALVVARAQGMETTRAARRRLRSRDLL